VGDSDAVWLVADELTPEDDAAALSRCASRAADGAESMSFEQFARWWQSAKSSPGSAA
jgi:hypothetical protein